MYTRINVWGAVLLCRLAPACDWPIAQIYSYIFPKGGGKFLPWCSEDVSHTHSLEGGEKKKKEKKALQDTPCTGSHHSAMLLPWDTSILMLHNSVAWGRTFSLYGTHWICPQPLMAQCLSVNLVFWLSSYSAGMTKKKKKKQKPVMILDTEGAALTHPFFTGRKAAWADRKVVRSSWRSNRKTKDGEGREREKVVRKMPMCEKKGVRQK